MKMQQIKPELPMPLPSTLVTKARGCLPLKMGATPEPPLYYRSGRGEDGEIGGEEIPSEIVQQFGTKKFVFTSFINKKYCPNMLDQFYVNLPFFRAPQTLLQKGAKRDYLARLPKKQLLENIKKILISTYLLLLTLLNASCSRNPDEELSKELKTVSSWAATAHMVGEASIKGTVPTVYAKETLKKSREKLQEQTDKLSKSPAAQEKKVLEQLQQIQKTISQMSTAVEQKDNKEVAIQLQHLSKQEKMLRTLAKQLGDQ